MDIVSWGCLRFRSTCEEMKNTTHQMQEENSTTHLGMKG